MAPKNFHFDPTEGLLAAATEEIRRPDPTCGWAGDTDLYVVHNRLEARWEVWREDDDGEFRMVTRQRTVGADIDGLDLAKLKKHLASKDTRARGNSHEEMLERVYQENLALDAAREKEATEQLSDTMQRVYHAAASTDLKTETGYVRPMTVSGALKDRLPKATTAVVPD